MSEHVSECIYTDLTSATGIANDLESTDEGDMVSIPIPIITSSTAVTFLQDLTFYFQNDFQFPHFQLHPGLLLRLIFLIL